ncbi:hypothetical protein [Nitrososphaera sp.]|uniref:hypothetical protein n=1 Tax=Nitrososphaera sp. TaxID=1971748 RepID=UPI00307D4677
MSPAAGSEASINGSSNGSGNSKRATVTMTFRIEESVMAALRSESEKKEVSLNTLVNQVLKRFVEWDMFEPKVGMIPIARPVVQTLFEKMSREGVVEMAQKVGKGAVHDIALFMKSKMDLDSFLSWLEMRMKNSSIEFSHRVRDGRHVFIMKHDLGYNWSLYHKTLLELIFNEVLQKRVESVITASMLTFAVED